AQWPERRRRESEGGAGGRPPPAPPLGALAAAARNLTRLYELHARVVGRMQEGDAAAVGKLDGPFQELGAQLFEAPDVRLDVRGVEAEVLEADVRGGVSRLERLARAGTGDVHGHAAVHALAADKAVPEHPRLVVDDLEIERPHVPLRGAARIRGLQVDVVDPVCHDASSGLRGRWRRSPSMITILVVVTPITSVPVVRPGSTAVMVARGTEYAPRGAYWIFLISTTR